MNATDMSKMDTKQKIVEFPNDVSPSQFHEHRKNIKRFTNEVDEDNKDDPLKALNDFIFNSTLDLLDKEAEIELGWPFTDMEVDFWNTSCTQLTLKNVLLDLTLSINTNGKEDLPMMLNSKFNLQMFCTVQYFLFRYNKRGIGNTLLQGSGNATVDVTEGSFLEIDVVWDNIANLKENITDDCDSDLSNGSLLQRKQIPRNVFIVRGGGENIFPKAQTG